MLRSNKEPVEAEVKGWPRTWNLDSLAQSSAPDDAMPMKIYADPWPRSNTPPNKAEVIGWPFPQFSQKQTKD
jgi:hypothetical protein